MQREVDAYFLNASNDNGPLIPSGGGNIGEQVRWVSGSTASPVNAWTHLAMTYDGAQMRLYVNGVLAAGQTATGPIQTNSNALRIGGNFPYGEFFQGLIDEVRVYNRALSQAEIQTDMNNPVEPTEPDTTAPSAPTGLVATAVSSGQINLAWTASTDNIGVTGYRVERCQESGCISFAEIAAPTTNSFNNLGLAAGASYSYRVRALDAAGNTSGFSNVASASTPAPDTIAPTDPSALTATATGSSQVNLAWTASTDNVGVSGYRVERCTGAGCNNFAQIATPSVPSFSNTGLTASTSYNYRVRAADAAGNLSGYSNVASVTTGAAPDTTVPTAPASLTATVAGMTQINLAWNASTDNVGVTGYNVYRCQGASCTNFALVGTSSTTAFSSTGLAAGTTYRHRVRALDAAGNLSGNSNTVSSTTQSSTDTTLPTAPTGLAATVAGTSQVNLAWNASTDNVGVTGYNVYRCTGASCTNFVQVGTASGTSFSSSGLAASTTYRFRVRATDAAGNLSGNSNTVAATTQAIIDTLAPTDPTGLTASVVDSGQINLAWTASTDNVAVTGYRVERCLGAGCINFVQVAAPTSPSFSNTSLTASTSYSFRVRAADAAGNLSGYSSVVSATTAGLPPPGTGLVLAYSFNAGSGTTVIDASSNGNNGTINGATWSTQGRYGGALSFNGTSNMVVIPNSASLNLSAGMTLQAWIMPTAVQSGWRTVMQREVDAYFLNASNDNGPLIPSGGGHIGDQVQWVSGSTASPVNAWTHLAMTYDGAQMRLYVNGVLAAGQTATGPIQTNSNALRIGGNVPYGEFFQGLIDEVRVYNRALSQAEIQTDMNNPVEP
jgi:fibronectin type 3 domain-containing protein